MAAGAGEAFESGAADPPVIVVGLDGTRSSLRAAAYATGMASRQGGRLVAVWVRPEPALAALFVAEAAGALTEARQEVEQELRRSIEWAAEYYGVPEASLVVLSGDPYRELVRVADEVRADTLIVGASTHAGHRFAGSLGIRLVRTGRWPVTVVP
jgi:nucleotide-binding universal stress UspA family protein